MRNIIYYSELFSIYSCLLTEKQKEIFKLHCNEDLSLSEISEIKNVSKSYVGKIIQEVQKRLDFYERNIGYYKLKQKLNSK